MPNKQKIQKSLIRYFERYKSAVGLYIDELQNLDEEAMRGIIVALHRSAQELLPLYLIGSGLPTVRTLVGKSKTYAERMFVYESIGALDEDASWAAIVKPFEDNGIAVENAAFAEMFKASAGYPNPTYTFVYSHPYPLLVECQRTMVPRITRLSNAPIRGIVYNYPK